MKKTITKLLLYTILIICHKEAFAQSSDVLLISGSKQTSSSSIIHIDGNGKLHKIGPAKIDYIELSLNLNAEISKFTFNINGKEKYGKDTFFQCDNGKFVYVENGSAYPTIEGIDLLNYNTLQEAIDAFKKDKSEENAWAIWVLKTANGE